MVQENTTAEELGEAARGWVMKLVSGNVDEATLAGFKAWRAQSAAHAEAFDEARRAYVAVPMDGGVETALNSAAAPLRRRRRAIAGGAVAAALLLGLFALDPEALFPPDYAAPDGPAQQIALADGSRILLDGGSAVDVALGTDRRDIRLLRGRAWFEVEPDKTRPFVVSAQGGTATAVGTAFAVDTTDPELARVDVTHGIVRVAAHGAARLLGVGEAARWGSAAPARVASDEDRLAWREGRIVIRNRPLGDAAATLDRYIPGRVMVLGSVASARVGGVFDSARAEKGLVALARSQGARVRNFLGITVVSSW